MLPTSALPAPIDLKDRVVLFDGVCNLCTTWVQFLLRRDRKGLFQLASVQSQTGQALLRWAGLPTDHVDTMMLVEQGQYYLKSTAFLRIVRRFPWPWPVLSLGLLLPRFLRDWFYDRIARNRYAWFGKSEVCLLPTPEFQRRFLP